MGALCRRSLWVETEPGSLRGKTSEEQTWTPEGQGLGKDEILWLGPSKGRDLGTSAELTLGSRILSHSYEQWVPWGCQISHRILPEL